MSESLALSLEHTLELQQSVVGRAQLLTAGITDMTICRRIKHGEWQRLLPGVYALAVGPISTEQRRIASALFTGESAQLTGLNALHWYGFRSAPVTEKIHVLVPHNVRRRSVGFLQVQRTYALDEHPRGEGLYRLVSPARAVVDSCRATGELMTARAVMTEAVNRQFTGVTSLDDEIRRAGRSRTAVARRVLDEILAGVRSAPESELRDLVASSRVLPAALWNPRLTTVDGTMLPTPDGYLSDAAIALEVDSREHHAEGEAWLRTLRRHNILSQYGVLVLHVTPREIRAEPARVLRMIEQAYLTRMQNPPTITVLVGAPSSTESVNKVPFLPQATG